MKQPATALAIALLILASNARAQLFTHFRFLGGTTAANQSWNYSTIGELPTLNRWGFAGVASIEVINLQFMSILAEIQYSQKGVTFSVPLTTESDPEGLSGKYLTISPRIDYLSFPLLVQVHLPLPSITSHILVGGRADILIAKRPDAYELVMNRFRKSELGVTAGIGLELPIPALFDLLVEFRYDTSLQDSFTTETLKVRNMAFVILAGVRL